ncbi:SusD-like starch-binding protein associating with outer membrane [Pontibacter ummariensis]|uniref:Starch-binding associating with outer membrane n=1 Tax=Pontibacter ummariensis TaxID=1610492 RepID=A0A239D4F1_9BACT|nr:SusD/RagB family nutrient-binding outer membrane lipoprotein [Pontibacter ummariensis]PRY14218.1 SusD-like starch-binding protein associating with outer membrane [Pontibacter ummariensis]SNS26714.1 Starch-binding associating with outer membrane [Pontibacter ummariensis]
MKKVYTLLLAGLLLGGCSNFEEDINVNPNLPSEASNTQLIANAELYLSGLGSSPQGAYYAQYLSETQYPNLSLYNTVAFNFYNLYTGPLMNLEAVLTSKDLDGNEGPVNNQLAVAKILKAYYFWHMTDRWGDIPYSDALKGKAEYTPKYDTQEAIYNDLFKQLEEANEMTVPGNITNDIVYGGNIAQWKKLANTMRLLMALRLSEVNPAKGKEEFNKALEAGIMGSNDDNFTFKHLAEAANQNYWYDQIANQGRYWWALSETLVEHMKPVNDPRLPVFGDPNSKGEYVGLPYGLTEGLDKQDPSLLGTTIWKQDAPVYLVTYAQALFAKAEAAKLGWIAGGDAEAEANYNMAIEESVKQWRNGSTVGVAEMLETPAVAYDPARAIEQIATQRWLHLFMHGYEAWAEWRRTGYPELVTPDGKQVPTRQGYPTEEGFNNISNYGEAVQRQFSGQDNLYGHVWWDVD